jgi:sugar/nucleoside kinase (ribokinase family)
MITDGARGSYCFQDGKLEYSTIVPSKVRSTAGAGDAFLAGIITGIFCGLPLQKGASHNNTMETPLRSANDLGTLLASLSVTSPDTIHMGIDACYLLEYTRSEGLTLSDEFHNVFRDCLEDTQAKP